ncbi:MAG: UbiA prenyltransferase family protein [Gemmataceae bacterium]|nr:UbiA prenyltransferase family protein [Gemmataceae bacterium]
MTVIREPEGTLRVSSPQVQAAASAAAGSAQQSGRDRLLAYVSIARPDHWFKNVFMLAGVLLAYFCYPQALQVDRILPFLAALLATCLLASSNYVINEILDAPCDRSHPVKRHRPIPSGRVWLPAAYAQWILLAIAGLLIAQTVNWPFFWAGLFLLVMGLIYNVPPVRSKEVPYVDVLSESINNPIRLLLGWFVVTAAVFPPVSLLLAYWMIGAFFMAAKRLAEYRMIADRAVAGAYRRSFNHYDQEKLLISMFFYITCFALFLGVFIIRYHLELILIFPLMAGFVCYYLYVAFKQGSAAQSPEKLYREKGLMVYLAVCVAVFFLLMFTNIPVLYDWFNVPPSPVAPLWKF